MRMKIGALAAVAGVILAFGASASRAAIVETIINTDSDAAVGSIAFPTLIGDGDAGALFSYRGFTQADITSISWTLDPTTDAVVMLGLNALRGDNPCPNTLMRQVSTIAVVSTKKSKIPFGFLILSALTTITPEALCPIARPVLAGTSRSLKAAVAAPSLSTKSIPPD